MVPTSTVAVVATIALTLMIIAMLYFVRLGLQDGHAPGVGGQSN